MSMSMSMSMAMTLKIQHEQVDMFKPYAYCSKSGALCGRALALIRRLICFGYEECVVSPGLTCLFCCSPCTLAPRHCFFYFLVVFLHRTPNL